MTRHGGIAALALAAALLTACAPAAEPTSSPSAAPSAPASSSPMPSAPASPPPSALVPDQRRVVAEDLVAPWSIAFAGDRALVSERDTGRVLEVMDGATREVGTIPGVQAHGEGGLLGLAVREEHLYVYLTAGAENRIERYELVGEPGALELGARETILGGLPAAGNHNGGRIAFGPDGMLYATVGDAGQPDAAQDRESLGGKILRLTADGEVPADNPFAASLVYSYGHRNPQGLAWAADGTLYASEFGQDTWDELNVIEPGANYGWPETEGVAGRDGMADPILQWRPAEASPSGIAIVGDTLYLANLRGARLRAVPLDDPAAAVDHLVGEVGRVRDVALAPSGEVWILTNNTDGRGAPRPGDDRIIALGLR